MEKARVVNVNTCKKDSECKHSQLVEVSHCKKDGISRHVYEHFCNYNSKCQDKISGTLYIKLP